MESSRQEGSRFYMETQFRHYYHKFARVHKATIRLEHKPALSLEVDWAGTKIAYFDTDRDEMAQASLFVSVLPCSQLIYAEPFRDEKTPAWIAGHVHAFQYIGGVPKTLVPDNLKSGVTRPLFFEPDLNRTYLVMAFYYGAVGCPTLPKKRTSCSRFPLHRTSSHNGPLPKCNPTATSPCRGFRLSVRMSLTSISG